jgi:hypothetical protein
MLRFCRPVFSSRLTLSLIVAVVGGATAGVGSCAPADATDDVGEGEGDDEDDTAPDCAAGLPPPSDPCLPVCGNEQFVGQPCTKDGGECNEHVGRGAGFCTVDFDDTTTLAYCTRPCDEDADCGTDAVCTGDPADPDGPKGCIPAACTGEGEGEGEGE